jgi:hypothetical protein
MIPNPALLFLGIYAAIGFISLLTIPYHSDTSFAYNGLIISWIAFGLGALVANGPRFRPYTIVRPDTLASHKISIGNYLFFSTKVQLLLASSYILIILAEAFDCRGFPLLGLFSLGSCINYVDFGIPGIHGLANAIFYTLCLSITAKFVLTRKDAKNKSFLGSLDLKRTFLVIVVILAILQLHRQVLVSAFLQILFLISGLTGKIARLFISITLLVVIFGYLGDLRSDKEFFLQVVGLPDYPTYLPTGFIWVYIYAVTPLLNTIYNSAALQGMDHTILPFHTFNSVFPSFIRPSGSLDLDLRIDTWNVHSVFSYVLADFGPFSFLFFALLGSLWGIFYAHARKSLKYLLLNSIASMQLVLLAFGNTSFHISFIFEILLIYALWAKLNRSRIAGI